MVQIEDRKKKFVVEVTDILEKKFKKLTNAQYFSFYSMLSNIYDNLLTSNKKIVDAKTMRNVCQDLKIRKEYGDYNDDDFLLIHQIIIDKFTEIQNMMFIRKDDLKDKFENKD